MTLIITPGGIVRGIYDETIGLRQLGNLSIRRASQVEPDNHGQWWADLSPVGGPRLGPYPSRSLALAAEIRWLDQHLADLSAA